MRILRCSGGDSQKTSNENGEKWREGVQCRVPANLVVLPDISCQWHLNRGQRYVRQENCGICICRLLEHVNERLHETHVEVERFNYCTSEKRGDICRYGSKHKRIRKECRLWIIWIDRWSCVVVTIRYDGQI